MNLSIHLSIQVRGGRLHQRACRGALPAALCPVHTRLPKLPLVPICLKGWTQAESVAKHPTLLTAGEEQHPLNQGQLPVNRAKQRSPPCRGQGEVLEGTMGHSADYLQRPLPFVVATGSPGNLYCLVPNPQPPCALPPPPTACSAIVIDGVILAFPTLHTHCPPSPFPLLFAGLGPDPCVFIKATSRSIIVCSVALSSPHFLTMSRIAGGRWGGSVTAQVQLLISSMSCLLCSMSIALATPLAESTSAASALPSAQQSSDTKPEGRAKGPCVMSWNLERCFGLWVKLLMSWIKTLIEEAGLGEITHTQPISFCFLGYRTGDHCNLHFILECRESLRVCPARMIINSPPQNHCPCGQTSGKANMSFTKIWHFFLF